jgi:hypothetical protein
MGRSRRTWPWDWQEHGDWARAGGLGHKQRDLAISMGGSVTKFIISKFTITKFIRNRVYT